MTMTMTMTMTMIILTKFSTTMWHDNSIHIIHNYIFVLTLSVPDFGSIIMTTKGKLLQYIVFKASAFQKCQTIQQ